MQFRNQLDATSRQRSLRLSWAIERVNLLHITAGTCRDGNRTGDEDEKIQPQRSGFEVKNMDLYIRQIFGYKF